MAAASCEIPKCASCQFGKSKRRPTGATTTTTVPEKEGALRKDDLRPGDRVSMDHFQVTKRGRLYESRGRTAPENMYCGGVIFVDHASGHVHTEFVVNLTATETIRAKMAYERAMLDEGVVVKAYHTDNGVFTARQFMEEIEKNFQTIGFSGVGGHHANGIAERGIGVVMSTARTMMIHAAIRWPDVITAELWPMAVDYAVHISNHLPREATGMAPIDILLGVRVPRQWLRDLHVWGCPTYVLDLRLQDGSTPPT